MNLYWLQRKLSRRNPYYILVEALDAELSEYDFHCPEPTLYELAWSWVDQQNMAGKNKKSIFKEIKDNPSEAAGIIAGEILGEMAEERPGTDPFNHLARIPISLPSLLWVTQGLTLASGIAMFNDNNALAQEAIAGIVALLNRATEPAPLEELTTILGQSKLDSLSLEDPIILVPQSGLAYIARRLEGTVHNLQDGFWAYPIAGSEEQDLLFENLSFQAQLVRDLNRQYGQSSEPTEGS